MAYICIFVHCFKQFTFWIVIFSHRAWPTALNSGPLLVFLVACLQYLKPWISEGSKNDSSEQMSFLVVIFYYSHAYAVAWEKMVSEVQKHSLEVFMIYPVLLFYTGVYIRYFVTLFGLHREKIQFIRTEGTPGLVRLSSDADLVMLLR